MALNGGVRQACILRVYTKGGARYHSDHPKLLFEGSTSVASQASASVIAWRLHLASPPGLVYDFLAPDGGRSYFWAEPAGEPHLARPDRAFWRDAMVEREPPRRLALRYFGGSVTTFDLLDDGSGGTDLQLTDVGTPAEDRTEVIAGWISLLLALKATVDFSADLGDHSPAHIWAAGNTEH
jgi:hypothetical protein